MALKGKVLIQLPATVQADGGLKVSKENGVFTFEPDWSVLEELTVLPEPGSKDLWVLDPTTNVYYRLSVQALIDNLPIGPAGEIEIGDTTTLPSGSEATVVNSGTETHAILEFGIPRGADASLKWSFETSTTMASPATGGIRLNNASIPSVTAIAVNAQTADTGNPDQSDYVVLWDNSTNTPKGYLQVREENASAAVFEIGTVTDNGTWLQLAVTYVSGSLSLTASDALYLVPTMAGNKGADGAGTGDVTAASTFGTDNRLIRSDGTSKGVQSSGITIDDSNNVTGMATNTLPNAGLKLLDTNASHSLIVSPGSDLTADRTLTVTTGDANRTVTINGNVTLPSGTVPVNSQVIQRCGLITAPSNKDYRLILDSKYGFTINEVTTRSASGTCTATFKINTTALGGSANSVSSTETTQSHSSANVVATGDDVVVTISSNSSCADMAFTIKGTRTLA